MSVQTVETLVIGGGQAGLAMSAHLGRRGMDHLVLERHRIAERWRTERWDSLVANGPAWHDRFPDLTFDDIDGDSFASKDRIVRYFETYAAQNGSPIRCGVEVRSLERMADGMFRAEAADGAVTFARNVVSATGPFQKPVFPPMIPQSAGLMQMHSQRLSQPRPTARRGGAGDRGGVIGGADRG
jgi:putative flavoprotein involved in K+ transport